MIKKRSKLTVGQKSKLWKHWRSDHSIPNSCEAAGCTNSLGRAYLKKRIKKECDRLWSLIVRRGRRCLVCGQERTDAHHLIGRGNIRFRWDLKNGVALCPRHHKWDQCVSPHTTLGAAVNFMEFLSDEQREWFMENKDDKTRVLVDMDKLYDIMESIKSSPDIDIWNDEQDMSFIEDC